MTGQAMMLPPAKGCCMVCATRHDPKAAHNVQSMFYGMRFQDKYGRAPTWYDAVAHLEPEAQLDWIENAKKVMARHGLMFHELPEGAEAIAEPYEESKGPESGAIPMESMGPVEIPMDGKPVERNEHGDVFICEHDFDEWDEATEDIAKTIVEKFAENGLKTLTTIDELVVNLNAAKEQGARGKARLFFNEELGELIVYTSNGDQDDALPSDQA